MSNKSNDKFLPGVSMGPYSTPQAEGRANTNWNLRAISHGYSVGLIADGAEVWKLPIHELNGKQVFKDALVIPYKLPEFEVLVEEPTTCELPVPTGNERSIGSKGKEYWKVPSSGEWVPACTRGCDSSYRNGVCFHGIPFSDRCTDNCPECRKAHRSRRSRNAFKGDAWTPQHNAEWYEGCLTPIAVLSKKFPGLKSQWDEKLREEPWSEEESRGRDQSEIGLLAAAFRTIAKDAVVVYEDFDGTLYKNEDLATRFKLDKAITQLTKEHHLDPQKLSIVDGVKVCRTVPMWTSNDKFIADFLRWLYPHVRQKEKREKACSLIYFYWRRFESIKEIATELKLTEKGIEMKLSRLKEKAKEFAQLAQLA